MTKLQWRKGAGIIGAIALVTLALAGCAHKDASQQASFKNNDQQTTTSVQSRVTNRDNLWYVAGGLNAKSNSGMEAYRFISSKKVAVYNVSSYYQSYSAAKSKLSKTGTLSYKFTGDKTKPTIIFKGKLAGVPMTQTFKITGTTSGTNKKSKVKLSGYKMDRDVDDDTTKAVFVTAN